LQAVDDRDRLLARLRKDGCSGRELERAIEQGRIATVAVERALGGGSVHTLTALAQKSKLEPGYVRELMLAMGRPNPKPRERLYTDNDLEVARLTRGFLDAGMPRQELLEVARVLSLNMTHTTEAIRRMVGNALLEPGDSEFTVGLRYAEAVDKLAPLVPPLLMADFRAHLRDGLRDHVVSAAERRAGELDGTQRVGVAFADLVDYTRMGEQLDPEEIGQIAGRMLELSTRSLCRPVQLVKTIGDAAMFVSPEVVPLVSAMESLVGAIESEGKDFPGVRVGIACGPAVTRGGDWFGATVNLASRVTDLAKPGRIVATAEVQELVDDRDWRRRRRLRPLKGIEDRIRLFSLQPSPSS
jgi:adenylate cyclase